MSDFVTLRNFATSQVGVFFSKNIDILGKVCIILLKNSSKYLHIRKKKLTLWRIINSEIGGRHEKDLFVNIRIVCIYCMRSEKSF